MSEEYRHQCEVRQVLKWRKEKGSRFVHEYIAGVAKARGANAAKQLENDCRMQWNLGNRGNARDWFETPVA